MTSLQDPGPTPLIEVQAVPDPMELSCPVPIPEVERVLLGHGSGGQLSAALMRDLIGPALGASGATGPLNDAAIVEVAGQRLAFTTDSFVVSPLVFPGGDIGELAVNGTVNDLAMMGATPIALSLAYVIEEGLPFEELRSITASVGRAAARAGVPIVTGDTKVVGRGAADGLFVNTAGIGLVEPGVTVGADQARPGDVVILSGPIGLHGVAIMSVREGLGFEVEIASDTQPLAALVAAVLAVAPDVHVLRDPTRGGLASALNEIAERVWCGHHARRARHPHPGAGARRVRDAGPRSAARRERGQMRRDGASRTRGGRAGRDAWRCRRVRVPRSSGPSSPSTRAWSPSARSSARSASWTCSSVSSCRASADRRGRASLPKATRTGPRDHQRGAVDALVRVSAPAGIDTLRWMRARGRRTTPLQLLLGCLAGCLALLAVLSVPGTAAAPHRWVPRPTATFQYQLSGTIDVSVNASVFDIDAEGTSKHTVDRLHARGRHAICYIDAGSWEPYRSDADKYPDAMLGNDRGWLARRALGRHPPALDPQAHHPGPGGPDVPRRALTGSNTTGPTATTSRRASPSVAPTSSRYDRWLAWLAHDRGLSVGLKNSGGLVKTLVGRFDFAVTEECFQYHECGLYRPFLDAGKAVFDVEYQLSRDRFCAHARVMGISASRKHLSLSAWRRPC